ncbi:RNA polymerase sigma factor [Dactylosporangium matsuzakiense]|uniref:RNA polymerase sigma factor 70 region 4 type 2 domain-containing protein n=1 Tax=Dactylosporangium matsuzakiense TaxID=53360 RepID=A0A9W6KYZ7_9ACTN|nr:sigma-70 family RNA polymerase sigma factor [Dactylosporangium matsuzakiense]GLL08019.1 hypothetical protein GCM10017581_097790 [Dactylosporangium matsuzakiense]
MVDADQRLARPAPSPSDVPSPAAVAPRAFTDMYTAAYRDLMRTVLHLGATEQEAEDAISDAMLDTLIRWTEIDNPVAYARTAAKTNFLKARARGTKRICQRMVERGAVDPVARVDSDLEASEHAEWVRQHLAVLTPAERAAIAFAIDGYTIKEIAAMLGKNEPAVRRNLHDGRQRLKRHLHCEKEAP